jgi:hypothetical protein
MAAGMVQQKQGQPETTDGSNRANLQESKTCRDTKKEAIRKRNGKPASTTKEKEETKRTHEEKTLLRNDFNRHRCSSFTAQKTAISKQKKKEHRDNIPKYSSPYRAEPIVIKS